MEDITRKDFIKLTTLGSVGMYISACHQEQKKQATNVSSPAEIQHDLIEQDSSSEVSFFSRKDPEYENLRTGFNKRIQKFPLTIALCKSAEGISAALKYAKKNHLPVSIKSGGHCFEGFSSNNNGLVINLSLLNKVEWLNNDTVKVGPACTLAKLYDNLLPKNKFIPAGSCGGVGVGGLTLGGGYGLFSRKYGLTCDSLLDFTLVDANGVLHTGSKEKDLLWACKGGGNGNFGVVSEMIFKTHEAPQNFRSHRFKLHKVEAENAEKILEQWFKLTANLPLSCFSAFVLNTKTVYILLTDFENNSSAVQSFKEALTPLVDTITIGKPQPIEPALKVFRGQSLPTFFKNSSAGLYNDFDSIRPFIGDVIRKVIHTKGMIYQVNTLGGNIHQTEFEEASAYPHRKFPYLSELQTYWDTPGQTRKYENDFAGVQDIFKKNNITTQYRNYPDINFSDWEGSYYGDNYEKLKEIKKKYDPENLFRYDQSIKL